MTDLGYRDCHAIIGSIRISRNTDAFWRRSTTSDANVSIKPAVLIGHARLERSGTRNRMLVLFSTRLMGCETTYCSTITQNRLFVCQIIMIVYCCNSISLGSDAINSLFRNYVFFLYANLKRLLFYNNARRTVYGTIRMFLYNYWFCFQIHWSGLKYLWIDVSTNFRNWRCNDIKQKLLWNLPLLKSSLTLLSATTRFDIVRVWLSCLNICCTRLPVHRTVCRFFVRSVSNVCLAARGYSSRLC